MEKMSKTLAFIAFPFYYICSPIIAVMNNESLDRTNEKIWLKLNSYKDKQEVIQ